MDEFREIAEEDRPTLTFNDLRRFGVPWSLPHLKRKMDKGLFPVWITLSDHKELGRYAK